VTLDDIVASPLEAARPDAVNTELLRTGFSGFGGFLGRLKQMRDALADLADIGDAAATKGADRLVHQIDAIEPSITFIGQVKAGKTSLINAMLGWPGLLPADVNPWTSVVTSIHLAPAPDTVATGAHFRFFDREEWARLVEKGGRLGELASRAGAQEELEKVRRQVERMREKSQGRLGRRFEMLLGQDHRYSTFDRNLVERYVCLGDEFEDDDTAARFEAKGRFADITKSADLFIDHAEAPLPLCIRDTPGVNDTFLMREQITIGAIRDSRLCVLVLSAHQALSSVDMALIRLISNVKARDIIIFVNRIDELSDPASQIGEIRDSIRATLKRHKAPEDVLIHFGSAVWGLHALTGRVADLPAASRAALARMADNAARTVLETETELAWSLSGLPALCWAIAERIEDGAGREALDRVARGAANLARGVTATQAVVGPSAAMGRPLAVDIAALQAALKDIEARAGLALERTFEMQNAEFATRLDRAHRSFLNRATGALIDHLEKHGERAVWSYEPTGLRMLFRSTCQLFASRVQADARAIFAATAEETAAAYGRAFALSDGVAIEAPEPPRISPPVAIAQTIALDIKGTWWRRWWLRRRGYRAFAIEFYQMIMAETSPMLDQLQQDHALRVRDDLRQTLNGFFQEQWEFVLGLAEKPDLSSADLGNALGLEERSARLRRIESTVAMIRQDAA